MKRKALEAVSSFIIGLLIAAALTPLFGRALWLEVYATPAACAEISEQRRTAADVMPLRRPGYGLRGAGFYPQAAVITALDYEADAVTVETATGFIFQFYGVEDFTEGDIVALLFYDNGTWQVIDDAIIDARATGFSINDINR